MVPLARYLRDVITGIALGFIAAGYVVPRVAPDPRPRPDPAPPPLVQTLRIEGQLGVILRDAPDRPPTPPPAPAPAPAPAPGPTPAPAPTPAPPATPKVSGTIWINWLTDPLTVTQQQANITAELANSHDLVTLDANFNLMRRGQSEMARTHMDTYANALGYPCAVVVGPDGSVLEKIADPTSSAQVLDAVRRYR